ncbi:MAG TPA: hypothetical protein VGS27_36855 [Candidatus Sulfotelmatobacter sp.]|nr:hypothetical protein [Candidatus Sulfotelmatobacter sp.]
MRRFWVSSIAVAVFGWPAWGQRVETEKAGQGKIVHVQTALDHLTVLEMSESVSAVAVGSSSFRVEWRGNKVFIEPTETGVATNLFVWTPSGRFNYELDPVGSVPEMVFAIDQPATSPPKAKTARTEINRPADPSLDEVLMDMTPVRLLGRTSVSNRVSVSITSLVECKGQTLIRYSIRNDTNHVYLPGSPQVVELDRARYRQSLYTLRDYQLGPKESAQLKSNGVTLVHATATQIPALQIRPGDAATGIVTIKVPSVDREPIVLQLNFLAGPEGPVRAILVL